MLNTSSVVWSDDKVWTLMLQLGVLLIAMLIGNLIRMRVSFIRKLLFPTALIAGLLLFAVKTVLQLCHVPVEAVIDNATMQIITYHTLGIGFAALALKKTVKNKKLKLVKVFDTALINGGSYMLQASVGLLITLLFFGGIYFSGIILPLGFGQGPGNAMVWGANYEKYGLTGGVSFGLTVATVGFIVASVFGVIYMNVMRRKGKIKVRTFGESQSDNKKQNGNAPDSESVDKLTINIAFIALSYALCYGFMKLLSMTGIALMDSLGWGLNFMWALFFASIVKAVLDIFEKKKFVKKEYRSNYLLDRISGFSFDLMIVAGVAAIEWEFIAVYWVPLLVLCTVGTALTFFYIYSASKTVFPGYEHETFLGNFGTLTGTVSNGMILMREIDPYFSTPAAENLVTCNFFTIFLNAPLFLLLASVPQGLMGLSGKASAWASFGIFFILFCFYTILLFRRSIFRKRYAEKEPVWTEENGYETDSNEQN